MLLGPIRLLLPQVTSPRLGDVADLPNTRYKHRERGKMRRQRNMSQVKEQHKTSEKELHETEINNLPDKEFQQKVIIKLTDLERRMDELSENFNEEFKNIKSQSEMKNTIWEMKNSLEGLNSGVDDTEEWICELDERPEGITQAE